MTTTSDLIKLNKLLMKIYKETKLEKFYTDAIQLEQYIWTLSDIKKLELGIQIEGSHDGKKLKIKN
jgi:hypothetical protein